MKKYPSIELLERRIAPAAILLSGTAGDDVLTVIATSADSGTYQLNDDPVVPFDGATRFEFHGGDGDDTMTIVNPDGSVFAPVDGIVCAGDAQRTATGDKLVLTGGGGDGFNQSWLLGPTPDSGTIITSDGSLAQVISYAGLEPIVDTTSAATLTVTGTNASNAISYTVGSVSNRGLVAVDNNETIEFANKTTLVINALGGDDTITLNNPNVPTGLTTINVDSGEGKDQVVVETSGSADVAAFTPTSANSATLAITGLFSSTLTRVENVVYRNTNSSGLDNLTINGIRNDTTDYSAATFFGSFRSLFSPVFDFSLVGRLTVNAAVGDFDVVNITGSAGDDAVTSTANAITVNTGGSLAIVTLGAGIDQVSLSTLDGNDNIDLDLTVTGLRKRVDAGAGNDTVNLLGTTDATISGGDGDDVLTGSLTADLIFGGTGNDVLMGTGGNDVLHGEEGDDRFGNPTSTSNGVADDAGNDSFFGGPGSDSFFWDPGDGDDVIEGGAGDSDQLFFFGNAGAEQFFLFADVTNRSRFHLFRVQAAIDIDAADLEEINLSTLGGADTVTVGRSDLGVLSELGTTTVRAVDISLGSDGAADNINIEGRPLDDNLLLSVSSAAVKVAGLSYDVRLDGSDAALDRLTINANEGNDTVVADASVAATIGITLTGGAGDDFLSADGTLNGNDGDDTLVGGVGNNTLDGGTGNDTFIGNGGTDAIGAGATNSLGDILLIQGTEGADTVVLADNASGHLVATVNAVTTTYTNFVGGPFSTSGIERVDIFALGGNDRLDASAYTATPTRLLGGDGNDVLLGGSQDDLLDGGAGRDVLRGGGGKNTLLNNGAFGFTAPTAYDVGKAPKGVATADLNGDTFADLVVVNSGSGTVSVLLGTAGGRFQDPVDFLTGGKLPNSVVIGDFSGDTKLDLAVANGGSKTIGLLLGDGLGGFAAATTVAVGKPIAALQTTDLTNDTKLDFIFLSGTSVGTLTGAGDGTFSGLKFTATGGVKPIALALADFNKDTFVDVVTANNGSNNVSFLAGSATGFGAAVKFRTGLKPNAIVAADFDADGNLDIAVTNAGNRFISVLTGNGSAAGAQFDRQLKITAPGIAAPAAIAAADFDGDGLLDLAVSNAANGSFSLLFGVGRGYFTGPIVFSLGGDPKMKPGALVVGDFDGDGAPDLAIAGSGSADVSVALTIAG